MNDTQERRRARGMSPEARREMIIRSTLPLVAEHGAAVTTSQIAQAAGIGEATIFRVFADKNELIDACVVEALRPDHLLAELADIPLDQPLAARLSEAGGTMQAHLARMGRVIGALHVTGHGRERPAVGSEEARTIGAGREESVDRTVTAIAELFRPEQESLRMPAQLLAGVFLGLMFSRTRPMTGDAPSLDDTVDLFLNGALT